MMPGIVGGTPSLTAGLRNIENLRRDSSMILFARPRFVLSTVVAMCIGAQGAVVESADTSLPAVTVTSGQAQHFVDDYLIATQDGLKRTLRQPVKDSGGNEPLLAIEEEFGYTKATLEANGTIVYDPRLRKWVMFALAFASNWSGDSADRVRLYRFTSPDAMNWTKGDDGTPQRIAIDLFDAGSNTSATNIDLFSCTYDETDVANPYKGWLFFANWGQGREGTYFVQSTDGRHWKRGPQVLVAGSRTIEQDGRTMNGTGDVTTFYHDRVANRFLGCLRWASAADVENTNRLRSRGFLFTERLDQPIDLTQITRLSLIPEGAMRNGDLPTDEYYSSTAWRYGSLWLGGLRIWHSRDDYPYSASGCAFLKLVVSRDGEAWIRTTIRELESTPPPTVAVAMMRIGFEGNACAAAYAGKAREMRSAISLCVMRLARLARKRRTRGIVYCWIPHQTAVVPLQTSPV
jgi:hypothetical protein